MKHFNIFLYISAAVFFSSCAAPSPEFEKQTFIPKKEVLTDTLYQQGVDLYKAGRFMDSEMKIRQALYIFPDAQNMRASLALVLKSSELFSESDTIYKDLIEKFPEDYDFQFALADSYFKQKKFGEARTYYSKAMMGYEQQPDLGKAAAAARSMASVAFLAGWEKDSFCSSLDAVNYQGTPDQVQRHIKQLVALGYYETAYDQISPLIESPSDIKDVGLLKLTAIVYMGLNKPLEAKKFVELARENLKAGLKEADAELAKLNQIMRFKYPDPPDPDNPDEEEETDQDKRDKNLIFNEQNLLYWPANLVGIYYEYLEANPPEEES